MIPESGQPAESSERTLLESAIYYLSVLLKYKRLIIWVTGLAAIGVVAFSIVTIILPPEKSPLPNIYRAQSVLLLQ